MKKKTVFWCCKGTMDFRWIQILATNLPTLDLFADPRNMIDPENSVKKLVKILPELDYNDILKKVKSKRTANMQ